MSIASLLHLMLMVPLLLPASAADPELLARRAEGQLLHRQVDLSGLLQQRAAGQWALQVPRAGALQVIHIWAVECAPCVAELAELKRMIGSLRSESSLRFLLISETLDQKKLDDFLAQNRKIIPEVPQYQSGDGRLRRSLRDTNQPLTLLVDQNLLVRQAFVGSILERRSEVVDAIERLLRTTRAAGREQPR